MNRAKIGFILTALLFAVFIVFTVLTMTFDVGTTPTGDVGFYSLNVKVHEAVGTSRTWYTITKILGFAAIAEAVFFAAAGLFTLIRRKSLKKVDGVFYALAATYILLVVFYVAFELFPVNYRPFSFSEGAAPEASYPSTHTLLTVTVFMSGINFIGDFVNDKRLFIILTSASAALAVFTAVGRFLSGVHWLTDIAGGLILGVALTNFCFALKEVIDSKKGSGIRE